MPLKLMYITNKPEVAAIAERNGVDRIFVDMEYIGKAKRQYGTDSVLNHHTLADARAIRKVLTKSELLVRVNPIHESNPHGEGGGYGSSEDEIQGAIDSGADIVMLPYFKTVVEVERFLKAVHGQTRTMLLLETAEAAALVDEIASLDGVDEVHIGLNDLSISYHSKFLFEMLSNGTVERLCRHLKQIGKPYGFGGLASLGRGLVPAEMIVKEHYRLGSSGAILSRSFCNVNLFSNPMAIEEVFYRGVREIRKLEAECEERIRYFTDNEKQLKIAIQQVLNQMSEEKL